MQDFMEMDRRGLMARAMLLLGASAVGACDFLPGSKSAATLGGDQLKLLDVYAATLIPKTDTPGALEAGVPKVLAQMYTDWASDETRGLLAGGLDRLGAAARKATGKDFAELSPAERQAFLAEHDKASLVEVPPAPGAKPKGNPFLPVVSVADNGYAKLKDLVATLYYVSEAALTTELVYEHVPGKWQPSVKITPQSRPAVTFGAF
ncbi:MAG: gluconate 2-dehydrogenase subunit 3 family protein [Novosphingobium sp.]